MSEDRFNVEGYEDLALVLEMAYDQASRGKGDERHAAGKVFRDQPILALQKLYGVGFAYGQAAKKIEEAQRMDREPAVKEILGAIVYLSAAVIHISEIPPLVHIDEDKEAVAKSLTEGMGYPGKITFGADQNG